MSTDGHWPPPGSTPDHQGDTSSYPPQPGSPAYPPQQDAPAYAPSDAPGYRTGPDASGSDGGYVPPGSYGGSDDGQGGGRGGGFPWLAALVGIVAVAGAAFAVWFFLLRDSDAGTTPQETPTIEAPSDDAAPPEPDPGETDEDTDEPAEPTEDESEPTNWETDAPTETDEPTDPEDPSAEDYTDDSTLDGAIELEIGQTHTMPNGGRITLDSVERGAECAALPGESLTLLTFTVEAGPLPMDTPQPGITLRGPSGSANWLDSVDCVPQDQALTPLVTSMESATGVVAVVEPGDGEFPVTFTSALDALAGSSASLRWTID